MGEVTGWTPNFIPKVTEASRGRYGQVKVTLDVEKGFSMFLLFFWESFCVWWLRSGFLCCWRLGFLASQLWASWLLGILGTVSVIITIVKILSSISNIMTTTVFAIISHIQCGVLIV